MLLTRKLVEEFGNPLDWNSATKATLLLGVCFLMHSQYLLWAYYQVSGFAPPENATYVDIPYIAGQIDKFNLLIFLSLSLFLAGFYMRKHYPDHPLLEHVAAQYYGLTLSYCSYLIGNLSIATGVVIAGAPVVGFILFNRRAVFIALATSLVAQIGISYACTIGYFPYAPIVKSLQFYDGTISQYWLINLYLFTAPHLLLLTIVAYHVLSRWRQRENEIRVLSLTDPLTQLSNRRSIMSTLDQEVARSCRHDPPLAILLVDLDHFKNINDTHGHPAGDLVLRAAAQSLANSIRQNDHIGRYGGEEFLIILPETTTDSARQLAERCRTQIEALRIETSSGKTLQITASFGLFCNENNRCDTPESMLHLADEALYEAKNSGRNRVAVSEK